MHMEILMRAGIMMQECTTLERALYQSSVDLIFNYGADFKKLQ